MTSSSGFDVDGFEDKKEVGKIEKKTVAKVEEDEEEEEFSFRPAYSRNGHRRVVGNLNISITRLCSLVAILPIRIFFFFASLNVISTRRHGLHRR